MCSHSNTMCIQHLPQSMHYHTLRRAKERWKGDKKTNFFGSIIEFINWTKVMLRKNNPCPENNKANLQKMFLSSSIQWTVNHYLWSIQFTLVFYMMIIVNNKIVWENSFMFLALRHIITILKWKSRWQSFYICNSFTRCIYVFLFCHIINWNLFYVKHV